MNEQDSGRLPQAAPGQSRVEPVSAVSSLRPSVPSAVRHLQWPVAAGYLTMTFPSALTLDEVDDIEQVLAITVRTMRDLASAIETRGAETAGLGPQDKSAARDSGDARKDQS